MSFYDESTKGLLRDASGEEHDIQGYKEETFSTVLFWTLVVISFGLFYVVYVVCAVCKPEWAVQIRYTISALKDATTILVEIEKDKFKACTVEFLIVEKSPRPVTPQSTQSDNSLFLRRTPSPTENNLSHYQRFENDIGEVTEYRYIYFQMVRYYYSMPFNSFNQLTGLDGNNTIIRPETSINGLTTEDVRILQCLYGPNTFTLDEQSYLEIFLADVMSYFYAFQIFSICVWLCAEFYVYVVCVIIIGSVIITITLRRIKPARDKIRNALLKEETMTVVRDGYQYVISSLELVPGDIVVVSKSGRYLTFDGLVLTGQLVVNEGFFTGITKPKTKTGAISGLDLTKRLPKLSENSNNAIFNGTTVLDTSNMNKDDSDVLAVVVNTSFLSIKGTRIAASLKYRNYSYTFDKDCMTYLKYLCAVAAVVFTVALIMLLLFNMSIFTAVVACLRLFTVAIPPSLPFALTVAALFAMNRLEERNIIATKQLRLTVAGTAKCIVFDKTGTLTQLSTDLLKVVESKTFEEQALFRDQIAISWSPDKMTLTHILYNMATCHCLQYQNNRLYGNPIDLETFKKTGWVYNKDQHTRYLATSYPSVPTITDDLPVMMEVHRIFPFDSNLRRTSVITRPLHGSKYAFYIKGAPETILQMCDPTSVPENYNDVLEEYTKQSHKVIALGYKELDDFDEDDVVTSAKFENNIIFLGFLIFGDVLKDNAISTVKELHDAGFFTMICTGDNLTTAIGVARECGILPNGQQNSQTIHVTATIDDDEVVQVKFINFDDGSVCESVPEHRVLNGEEWMSCRPERRIHYVLTGDTWQVLNDYGGPELDRVIYAATVFARMNSGQKKNLVEMKRKMAFRTCMVGDGTNDLEALNAADVGISLSLSEAGIGAPFSCKKYQLQESSSLPWQSSSTHYGSDGLKQDQNIAGNEFYDVSCVIDLLREGRTALAEIFTIFMFTACYSLLGMTAELMLYSMLYEISQIEWIYIDLFLVISIALALGYSDSSGFLHSKRPTNSLWDPQRLLSIVMFLFVCIAVQVFVFFYIKGQTWYIWLLATPDDLTAGSMEATYVFFLLIYQLTFPAIVYTLECKFREPIFKNKFVVALFIFFYIINTYLDLYPFPWLAHLFQFYLSPSFWFRVQIILFVMANGLVSVLMELIIIDWCICDRIFRCFGFGSYSERDIIFDSMVDRNEDSPIFP